MAAILSPGCFGGNAKHLRDDDIIVVNRCPPDAVPDRGPEKLILGVDKDRQGVLSLRRILHLPALMFSPESRRRNSDAGAGACRSGHGFSRAA